MPKAYDESEHRPSEYPQDDLVAANTALPTRMRMLDSARDVDRRHEFHVKHLEFISTSGVTTTADAVNRRK